MNRDSIDKIWWCAISPEGWPRWDYIEGRRKDVVDRLLNSGMADWKAKGWRIAKLRVVEEIRR